MATPGMGKGGFSDTHLKPGQDGFDGIQSHTSHYESPFGMGVVEVGREATVDVEKQGGKGK